MNSALADRVAELERRMLDVEQRLGIESPEPVTIPMALPMVTHMASPAPVAVAPLVQEQAIAFAIPARSESPLPIAEVIAVQLDPQPVIEPPVPIQDVVPDEADEKIVAEVRPVPPPLPAMRAPVLPYVPAPALARVDEKPKGLEQMIGLKWAGWIGSVILVIGMGLGVKFAYDQGWFGIMPNWARVTMMYLAGFGLIGAGEVVYRKVNRISAVGLFAAGVAGLFLVSYAGHRFYGLYSPDVAFVLMGISTLIGASVAVRGDLVSIALLSLVGGNVVPLVLGSSQPHLTPFLSYLLMLQVVALLLAGRGRKGKWWILRGFSFASTSLWMQTILLRLPGNSTPLLAFVAIYAALFHLELIISVLRGESRRKEESFGGGVFAGAVTFAAISAVLWVVNGHVMRGVWIIGMAGISAVLAEVIKRRGSDLRISALATSYRLQAFALVIVAVPAVFGGINIIFIWTLMSLVFAAQGRLRNDRVAALAGMATWLAAVMKLAIWWGDGAGDAAWLSIAGQNISAYLVMAMLVTVAGHAIAQLTISPLIKLAEVISAGASALAIIAMIVGLPGLAGTAGILLFAWALVALDALTPKLAPARHAAGALTIALMKWAVVDTLNRRIAPDWSATAVDPIFNASMGIGALVAMSIPAIYFLRKRSFAAMLNENGDGGTASNLNLLVMLLPLAVIAIGLSFEIDRIVERAFALGRPMAWSVWQTKQLAWTLLWSATVAGAWQLSRLTGASNKTGRLLAIFAFVLANKFAVVDTLLFAGDAHRVVAPAILFNLQMFAGAAVAGMLWMLRRRMEPAQLRWPLAVIAMVVALWAGSFEITRITHALITAKIVTAWPEWQLNQILWTLWWATPVLLSLIVDRVRRTDSPRARELRTTATIILAMKWIVVDAMMGYFSHGAVRAPIVLNIQMISAILMAGLVLVIRRDSTRDRAKLAYLAIFIAIVAGSIELDRILFGWQIQFAWTLWWTLVITAAMLIKNHFEPEMPGNWRRVGAVAMAMISLKFMLIDSIALALLRGPIPGTPLANLQTLTAAGIVAALIALLARLRPSERLISATSILIALITLLTGSFEIDRAVPPHARQVGLSVFWAFFAIALVVIGFKWRRASLRYFALGLYAITLLKIVFVDLSDIGTGYRILSFMGLGIVLLGTSVLYGKVSPMILQREKTPEVFEA